MGLFSEKKSCSLFGLGTKQRAFLFPGKLGKIRKGCDSPGESFFLITLKQMRENNLGNLRGEEEDH